MRDLIDRWRSAHADTVMRGWDFGVLEGRLTTDKPPWDFDGIRRRQLAHARHVLDMGTGGGEQLLILRDTLPDDTVATEGWAPNLPVARQRLETIGVPVVEYDPDRGRPMPFDDARFDLVMNRHESFEVPELARVLTPGGVFVSQQVGGDDMPEIFGWFGGSPVAPANELEPACAELSRVGFTVAEAATWAGIACFHDVEALVIYLALVPWAVTDDFAVGDHLDTLLDLHRQAERGQPIEVTDTRFWFRAVKPAATAS